MPTSQGREQPTPCQGEACLVGPLEEALRQDLATPATSQETPCFLSLCNHARGTVNNNDKTNLFCFWFSFRGAELFQATIVKAVKARIEEEKKSMDRSCHL